MLSLHHVHLMASDINATIAFWTQHFDGEVVHDVVFADARNVFLKVGTGRIHLYDQAPKRPGQGVVHHVGVETDNVEEHAARLKREGVSVTDVRRYDGAAYAMVKGPEDLLIELFQIDPARTSPKLFSFFDSLANSSDQT